MEDVIFHVSKTFNQVTEYCSGEFNVTTHPTKEEAATYFFETLNEFDIATNSPAHRHADELQQVSFIETGSGQFGILYVDQGSGSFAYTEYQDDETAKTVYEKIRKAL